MLIALLFSLAASAASPQQTADRLQKYLGLVPGGAKLRCLANDYLTIVGASPQSALATNTNGGLIEYLQASYNAAPVSEAEHTRDFYRDVSLAIGGGQIPSHLTVGNEGPTLAEKAGDAAHAGLAPGWVWDLAMKHAGGNANSAMRMIAVCGHDDVVQEPFQFRRSDSEKAQLLASRREWIKGLIAKTKEPFERGDDLVECSPSSVAEFMKHDDVEKNRAYYENLLVCNDPAGVPAMIEALRRSSDSLTGESFAQGRISCPSGFGSASEAFYLPESLGKGVDLDPAIASQIAKAQAPFTCQKDRSADPRSCLPSKYYHVYGSAFVACEMIKRGHSPSLVKPLQEALGWYYRAYWLGTLADKCNGRDGDSDFPVTPRHVNGWLNTLAELRSMRHAQACTSTELVDAFSDGDSFGEPEACDRATADAMYLLRKYSLLGKPGAVLPLIPNLGAGDEIPAKDQPASWTPERFQLARAKVKSIESDFAWTMAQHRIGAAFAAEHCKAEKVAASCGGTK